MHLTPLQFQVKFMTPEAALLVWAVANPAERADLRPTIEAKIAASRTMTPQQKGAAHIMLRTSLNP